MVGQLEIEKTITPSQQTIEIGKITLMLPIEVDPKPYIRQILRVDLESITHPKARECLEFGLADATTDEDFSSLIESFHLCRSHANAERLFAALDNDEPSGQVFHTIDELRQEFGLEEENT
jgi:predicted HAD superfamily Cof-like phosphohydrolase